MNQIYDGQLSSSVIDVFKSILDGLPRVLLAIAIIIVGHFISKVIAKSIAKIGRIAGIDKVSDYLDDIEIVQKMNTNIVVSRILFKAFYYFLFMIFLLMAADVLKMQAFSELIISTFNLLPKLILGLFILIFGTLLSESIRKAILSALTSLAVPSAKIISIFVFYFLLINVVIVAVAQAGINTKFLEQNLSILVSGIVFAFALGYGLASKQTMSNFLSSFYIQNKIKEGDKIAIDNQIGIVNNIDNSSISIVQENKEIIYPLSILSEKKMELFKE